MKCKNCGASMFERPLLRTNPKGELDAGWMCEDCIKTEEGELHNNLEEDGDLKIVNDIFNAIKGSTHKGKKDSQ